MDAKHGNGESERNDLELAEVNLKSKRGSAGCELVNAPWEQLELERDLFGVRGLVTRFGFPRKAPTGRRTLS